MIRRAASAVLLLLTAAFSFGAGAASEPFDKFEIGEGADLAAYERVYVAPVMVSERLAARIDYVPLNASDTVRPLSPGNVRRNVEEVEEVIKAAIGKHVTLVDEPGPRDLTIQIILTDLNPNRPSEAELKVRPTMNASSVTAGGAGASVEFLVGDILIALGESAYAGNALDGQSHPWRDADLYFAALARDIASLLD